MILPAFRPTSTWKAPAVSSLPSWDGAKRIGFDIETCDPDLKKLGPGVRTNGFITGFSVAIEDGPAFYLPIAHAGGGNLDQDKVIAYIRDNAARFTGDVVGANLQYDLDYSAEAGIWFPQATMRDVQIAEPLLDELQMRYSLDAIAQRRGMAGKDEVLLKEFAAYYGIDPKADMWKLPAGAVGPYAEEDTRLPLKLLRKQERQIDEEGLWQVYDMECQLQPVLMKMRRRGVRVDLGKLETIEGEALKREVMALAEIKRLTGTNLTTDDTNRTAALIPIIKSLGFQVGRTDKGNESLTNDILRDIARASRKSKDDPLTVPELIMDAKKWNKVRNTFCASIRRHEVNGRIHCTFNQMIGEDDSGGEGGARYGRLSCKQPNLQQQPSRDPEIGPLWRSIYLPEEGAEWISLDYSTQEPRWMTHYAELSGLAGAKEAAQAYRDDPTTDFHGMVAAMMGVERKPSKEIGLGKMYGMGGAKLAHRLGLPTVNRVHSKSGRTYEAAGPEAQALIDCYDEALPFVKQLAKMCETKAERRGWIKTAGGRHCRFPLVNGKYDWVFKALNRLIQGSSGDQMKAAMVQLDAAGIPIQLQVHDEVDLSGDRGLAEEGAAIMLNALPCNVPHRVDIEIGPSWGEIK